MKIGIASDHRGYRLKEFIKENLNYEIIDYGTDSEESVDYPDFAYKLSKAVVNNEVDFGVAICGTGIGISIALNKMKGIYCAKVSNPEEAVHTRNDNNTNVIAFGEKMDLNTAILSIEQFINTSYSYLEKHDRRNKKVRQIENGVYNG